MTVTDSGLDTLTAEKAMALESGDYGGPMRDVFEQMARWDRELIDSLETSMRKHGWVGPPIKVIDGVLLDGHHRAIAATRAGLDIPHSEEGGYSWEPDWHWARDITRQ